MHAKLPPDLQAAQLALARGSYSRAVSLFTRFLEGPDARRLPARELSTCYLNRGFALRKIGRQHEALSDYARASKLNPATFKPHGNAALILAQDLGRYADALVEFDRALELNPTDVDLLSSRGLTRMHMGDLEGAERDLRDALSVAPRDVNALCNLGNLYLQRGQSEQAAELYRQGLEVDPSDSEVRMNLALALKRMGAARAAEALLLSDRKARKLWAQKGGSVPRRPLSWRVILVAAGVLFLVGMICALWHPW